MTPQELLSLCMLYGVRARIQRDEVVVQVCLFCGNTKSNLELNPGRGVFKCWACGSKGALEPVLKKHFRFTGHVPVLPFSPSPNANRASFPAVVVKTQELSPAAEEYLRSRGLGHVDAQVYDIAEGVDGPWKHRAVFHLHEYWSRSVVGAIGRGFYHWIAPKYYAEWQGGKKAITGFRTPTSNIHVLVEGVFDGIAVHRAGFNAAVLGGVEGTFVDLWACRVPADDAIIVLLDGDAEVKRTRLHWQLYPLHHKTFKIDLPSTLDPAQVAPQVIRRLVEKTAVLH